jgi:hypothetical protein
MLEPQGPETIALDAEGRGLSKTEVVGVDFSLENRVLFDISEESSVADTIPVATKKSKALLIRDTAFHVNGVFIGRVI